MQIVIDIPEAWEKCNIRFIKECIKNGTPLPKNPTNGDMLKTMFNIEVVDDFYQSVGIKLNRSNYIQFNKDWWNAPYKGVSE